MKRSTRRWISVVLSACLLTAGCGGAAGSQPESGAPAGSVSDIQQESTHPSSWGSVTASTIVENTHPEGSSKASGAEESSTLQSSAEESSTSEQSSEASRVEIPDVTNLKTDEAVETLEALGLKTQVQQEYSSEIEAGRIIRQSVKMGASTQQGHTVILCESLGEKPSSSQPVSSAFSAAPTEESSVPAPSVPTESSVPQSSVTPEPVIREVESVSLNAAELTLKVGQSYQLKATLYPADAADRQFTWYWSDAALADMDSNGWLTAKAPGVLTVSAVTGNRKSASCTVTIIDNPPPASSAPESSQPSQKEKIVNYNVPYRSSSLYEDINALCARYPDLLSQYTLGWSTKGKAIPCLVMGHGSKKGCIVGGLHSREHIGISFVMRSVEEMADAYTRNEKYGEYDLRELLNKYTLYIVPMVNPDGTDIATAGESPLVDYPDFKNDSYKDNANGVNLNRNFPYHWDLLDQSYNEPEKNLYYYGTYAGSEKETQAVMSLCNSNSFEWLLDMHIVGNGIYWYDQLNGRIPNDSTLTHAIAQRCDMQEFPMTYTTAFGGLENWFRYTFQKPGLCVELVPYSQSNRSSTYYGMNSYFDDAVNWSRTKYMYPEAMRVM